MCCFLGGNWKILGSFWVWGSMNCWGVSIGKYYNLTVRPSFFSWFSVHRGTSTIPDLNPALHPYSTNQKSSKRLPNVGCATSPKSVGYRFWANLADFRLVVQPTFGSLFEDFWYVLYGQEILLFLKEVIPQIPNREMRDIPKVQ